ncbi:MAG: DUF3365 domain-containing protein [Desulfovibrionaceae bacterium]|nr:DUF3365 domain-containing protein [Desulfovibrionaceae bacterium]
MELNIKRKIYLYLPVFFWLVFVTSSLTWNIKTTEKGMEQTILNIGRSFFKEIKTTRLWNAKHGGVYVPITEETTPNPYLDVPNRDVITSTGLRLTKINPAFMTRQVAEIAKQESNIQYHITSLRPIRPANKAEGWETSALNEFESGKNEFFQFVQEAMVYRYMAPLPIKEACLKCHAKQGYKLGEIRGGISVTIPAKVYIDAIKKSKNGLILIHLIVLALSVGLFCFLTRYRNEQEQKIKQKNQELEKEIIERKQIEEALQKARDELEQRVEERTLELKKTHEQLLHAEKLSVVGRFSASIAHEFNNPLQGILNVFWRVQERATLDTKDQELVGLAVKECHRMRDLINNLQQFNKPTSGIREVLNIHQVIDEVLLFKEEFQNKKITIKKEYATNFPDTWAVADQLKQVFLNLLNNAADACVGGGTITVKTEMLGERVVVRIHDTGTGIKPEDKDHIFEPFFTTKPAIKGTGLGLSVSYGIVKGHGGEITVDSEPGKGTTFSVTLPIEGGHNAE